MTKDRRALSTIAAITLTGRVYKLHFEGSISGKQVVRFLKHIQGQIKGDFILIWDRARIHTGKIAQNYLRDHPEIHGEYLPAYAPELNPEEYCHGYVKRSLKNARPANKKANANTTQSRFCSLAKKA